VEKPRREFGWLAIAEPDDVTRRRRWRHERVGIEAAVSADLLMSIVGDDGDGGRGGDNDDDDERAGVAGGF
jgi:hypothetical protein